MNKPTLLLTLCLGASICSSAMADPKYSRYTADYYKGVYDQYEGQDITLKVAFVKPYSYKSDIVDARFFHAVTADETKKLHGGEIPIAVPINAGDDLIRRYGTAPSEDGKTHILHGTLRSDGHGLWFVDVNGTLTKNLDAIRQTEIKPAPTPAPAAPGASPKPAATPAHVNGAEPQHPWWKIW